VSPPAPSSPAHSSAVFAQLQSETFRALFLRFAKLRVLLAPVPIALVSVGLWQDAAPWRPWLLALAALLTGGGTVAALWRLRQGGNPVEARWQSFSFMVGPFFAVVAMANGGVESPLMGLLAPVCLFAGLFIPPREAVTFSLSMAVVLWGMLAVTLSGAVPDLIPAIYGGGSRAGHNDALLVSAAVASSFMMAWTTAVGILVRAAFAQMVVKALSSREEVLRTQSEAVDALTRLSGEIAHELKNPLASVKGLAALLARDLEGKPAERLAVLRREVDRMQEVLEGFLNFSRPLLPLNEQLAPLDALCRQVAELHEGMAAERGVAVRVFAERPVRAMCDPRKVQQVLINLVQNALEASPRGGAVEVVALVEPGGGARVEVRDRGAGLAEAVRARVFEPGVTTKAKGSGLGLAIARALARQHGGELALRPREGGGCVAELALPAQPPQPAAPPAPADGPAAAGGAGGRAGVVA
jgi:signal transduction histidine kinase